MLPLFLGLTAANLLLLSTVFAIGLFAVDPANVPTWLYSYHIALAIAAGMMTLLTHIATYTYFMATSRWLQAATEKANLNVNDFAAPAFAAKRRALPVAMTAIVAVMLTMFAGAASDPTVRPWWPGEVHMAVAGVAIAVNVFCAMLEYKLIQSQGKLMDGALAILNRMPGLVIEHA
jgi:hypothetical protein